MLRHHAGTECTEEGAGHLPLPERTRRTVKLSAVVFNVQRFSLHDGPGIRTIVFLKGCPLKCLWCANPESVAPAPQLGFARGCCNKCGKCELACPERAISFDPDGVPKIDGKRCTACGKCVPVCKPEALAIYGQRRSVEDVFEEVRRDAMFYQSSDGGVTVSGGEALRYPSFVVDLFQRCKKAGISTALETCGYAGPQALVKVLAHTDVVLYDLKLLDSAEHLRFTGKRNDRILDNARLAVRSDAKLQFRMPLVPGITDTPENIRLASEFLKELQGEGACIELMPYHRLGMGKYEALGRDYPLAKLETPGPEVIDAARQRFEGYRVRCLVSS